MNQFQVMYLDMFVQFNRAATNDCFNYRLICLSFSRLMDLPFSL